MAASKQAKTKGKNAGHFYFSAERLTVEAERDEALAAYLADLNKRQPFTAAQNREWVARLPSADARRTLIEGNLRLVLPIAARYVGYGTPAIDLIGGGNLGLIWGIDRLDPTRPTAVSTFVSWWIRAAVQQVHYGSDIVALPKYLKTLQLGMSRADTLGAPLTVQRASGAAMDRARSVDVRALSLDQPVQDDSYRAGHNAADTTLAGLIEDPDTDIEAGLVYMEDRAELYDRIDGLTPTQAAVIRLRYGLDGQPAHTQRETAAALGVTFEAVRKAEARAVAALRLAYNVTEPRRAMVG